jgi:hypothetical protein
MAHRHTEPEDIQTAHDADLFDQEETDSTMSDTKDFVDADSDLTQPSTSAAMRIDDTEHSDHVPDGNFIQLVPDGSLIQLPSISAMRVDKREMWDAQHEQVVRSVVRTKFVDMLMWFIQPFGKRRYQEVDFSKILRKTVYQQEERVNEMKRKLRANKKVRTRGSMDVLLADQ